MKRAGLAVVIAFATATAGCGLLPGSDEPDDTSAGRPVPTVQATTLQGYYDQELRWRDCGDGFQCARLSVPLDYRKPAGRQMSLPVVRLPAAKQGRRIGSLVLNPGGPGGSGVEYARAARDVVTDRVRARFDVVGFDPRGVAGSEPAVRCLPADELDEFLAADASPDSDEELRRLVAESREFVEGCRERSADLLPSVGTTNAARDMNVLRAALGDEGLTYLGKSYGTSLGAHYAELFPKRVRALVLDGAMDPDLSGLRTNLAQAKGFEVALRAFVEDCVSREECPFGSGDAERAIDRLERLLDRVDREPLRNEADDREVTQSLAVLGIASALYTPQAWPVLRLGLNRAFQGDGTTLVQLADNLVGRRPDGTYTNQTAANMAINCIDRPMPEDVSDYEAHAERADDVAPHFGEFVAWSGLPCAYWPIEGKPRDIDGPGADPILVVGTTRDPATPYAWAAALAEQLESGVLLTYDGDGHTAYLTGSDCIDQAIDHYLIRREVPAQGKTCG